MSFNTGIYVIRLISRFFLTSNTFQKKYKNFLLRYSLFYLQVNSHNMQTIETSQETNLDVIIKGCMNNANVSYSRTNYKATQAKNESPTVDPYSRNFQAFTTEMNSNRSDNSSLSKFELDILRSWVPKETTKTKKQK